MGLDIYLYVNPVVEMDSEFKTRRPIPDKNNVMIARWRNRWELFKILEELHKEHDPENMSLDQASHNDGTSYCMVLDNHDINHLLYQINSLYYESNQIEINGVKYTNYLSDSESMLSHDIAKLEIARLSLYMEPGHSLFAYWSY